jgi:hypothetical protein
MTTPLSAASIPGVVDVIHVRGAAADRAAPRLLLEVPHGATRTAHFTDLRAALHGAYPDDLVDFFHVNTDVGAPELALRTAERVVAAMPECAAVVLRCCIPRTFVDCNRRIDATVPGMTPGLHAWVRDPRDKTLLLDRYHAYRSLAERTYAQVCDGGGLALMVHSYAPRSIDVPVDDRIVDHLRKAYEPDSIGSWPLRPEVDFIARTPEGTDLAAPALLREAAAAFAAAGLTSTINGTYPLHPSTLAHDFAVRHQGRTLCLEVRRDLLVPEFTPFAEMLADPGRADRIAAPLAAASIAALRAH